MNHFQRLDKTSAYLRTLLKNVGLKVFQINLFYFLVVNTNQFVHLMWDKEPLKQLKGKLVMKEFNIVKYTANATIKSTDRDGWLGFSRRAMIVYSFLSNSM